MSSDALYFVFPGRLDTPTGGYHYDRRLMQELRQLGLKVETVSLSSQFPFPDAQALADARTRLAAVPDGAVVIIDGLAYGVLDALAEAEANRLRIIALCHHPLALESGLDPEQQQRLKTSEQRALQAARAVVVTSAHTGAILTTQFSISSDRIIVAQPGTDRVPFAPGDGNPLRLLTLASLTRRKAHDVLLDALAPLADLPWQARFVGSGDLDPEWTEQLHQQVKRLGLQPRIEFVGAVDGPEAEFQQADLFVLPSRYEGYGMVFAEALAAGLPVIAARAGAVPDVVPESAGLLVPPDDVEALTAALHSLLTREDLRREFQAGARRAASALPDWADTARQVADLIERVQQQSV
ncbi:MAG: glycosyltransferase family 4 protein [Natronospirillum sp.]|uniref:glycosyltransferase family 4 protein n=1 Tax=Natronospirillum sp. TaxID=2812955 RepID=UPI0025E948D1|nr:glycosyltransferase family 4 protein [Natronospirillum sp.]MCH8551913.1 glycosyltransferase family 4 protein [Natronospirillum sp.]